MFSGTEIFSVSGPSNLTVVDWENLNHQRTIAASLVSGAYNVELDRQNNRQGVHAEAAPYWEFFHFRLNKILIDDTDHSIFGVIYEYTFPFGPNFTANSIHKPPNYVIAFRGTLVQPGTRFQDLWLDFRCICNTIHNSNRVHVGIETVQSLCSMVGHSNVWVVGHSLGSAIGLLVGKSMAKLGFPIKTFLFNPPFIGAPIQSIKDESIRQGIHITGNVIKAGLYKMVNVHHHNETNDSSSHHNNNNSSHHRHLHHLRHHHSNYMEESDSSSHNYSSHYQHSYMEESDSSSHYRYENDYNDDDYDGDDESFMKLSSWSPHLFLNQSDLICAGYIGYFEHRKMVEDIIGNKLASMNSVESILSNAMGRESEPFDLLPSATVTVNLTPSPDCLLAHCLKQWWNPNFHFRSLEYTFTRRMA